MIQCLNMWATTAHAFFMRESRPAAWLYLKIVASSPESRQQHQLNRNIVPHRTLPSDRIGQKALLLLLQLVLHFINVANKLEYLPPGIVEWEGCATEMLAWYIAACSAIWFYYSCLLYRGGGGGLEDPATKSSHCEITVILTYSFIFEVSFFVFFCFFLLGFFFFSSVFANMSIRAPHGWKTKCSTATLKVVEIWRGPL